MTIKPILVSEANRYGGNPDYALYPHPPGSGGERLCRLVMRLEPSDYLERFERLNLCPMKWSTSVARERGLELMARVEGGATAVLLGAKVSRACGFPFEPFAVFVCREGQLVVLPHPGGLCRLWQEPRAFERARAALREAGVLMRPPGGQVAA